MLDNLVWEDSVQVLGFILGLGSVAQASVLGFPAPALASTQVLGLVDQALDLADHSDLATRFMAIHTLIRHILTLHILIGDTHIDLTNLYAILLKNHYQIPQNLTFYTMKGKAFLFGFSLFWCTNISDSG